MIPLYLLVNLLDFNSNMVRLKGLVTYLDDLKIRVFQFQYGSIKRNGNNQFQYQALKFQFQYGSIKRQLALLFKYSNLNFNSNMVRLKARLT